MLPRFRAACVYAESTCRLPKCLVRCPQLAGGQEDTAEEMDVDPAEAGPIEAMLLHKTQQLIVVSDRRLGQSREQAQDLNTIVDAPANKLADDEGMTKHLPGFEQGPEPRVTTAQVPNPDRSIDENAQAAERRRRIGFSAFSVPPSLAKRRALSRAISASSPNRSKAVFSLIPVSSLARLSNPSSMLRVVLICTSMHSKCRLVKPRDPSDQSGHFRIRRARGRSDPGRA